MTAAQMTNLDSTFRPLLVAAFAAILVIMAYHRIRAGRTREKLDRRQEGMFVLSTLRPAGGLFYGGAIAYMIDPAWMAWSSVSLPDWLRWTGVALCGFTVVMLLWTMRSLGPNLTDTVVTRRAHTLVMSGPYRWVRHPFYDCLLLMLLGFSLTAANWFLFVTGGLVFALLAWRSRTEEAFLLSRFGEPYRAYRMRTGRFLPRPDRR